MSQFGSVIYERVLSLGESAGYLRGWGELPRSLNILIINGTKEQLEKDGCFQIWHQMNIYPTMKLYVLTLTTKDRQLGFYLNHDNKFTTGKLVVKPGTMSPKELTDLSGVDYPDSLIGRKETIEEALNEGIWAIGSNDVVFDEDTPPPEKPVVEPAPRPGTSPTSEKTAEY